MRDWDPSFKAALIEARDYREFLTYFFKKNDAWSSPRALSFRQFADRAGFSSKSYLHEVLAKKKRLSPSSLKKVTAGLKLQEAWADYFYCLTAQEEPGFHTKGMAGAQYELRVSKLRKKLRLMEDTLTADPESSISKIAMLEHTTDICVSLGHPDVGATLKRIQAMTKLPATTLNRALRQMVEIGFIHHDPDTDRYHNIPAAINSVHGPTNADYRRYFWSRMVRAKRRMGKPLAKNGVFTTQTFTVKQSSLPELAAKLERMAIDFANDADDNDGDGIAEVLVTLTHNFD